jgi:hypothetical protein
MNPGFGGDELEGEAEPEGGAEEWPVRRLVAKKKPMIGLMVVTARPIADARRFRGGGINRELSPIISLRTSG